MYATPATGINQNANDLEDYLLGKKRVDKILTADENAQVCYDVSMAFIYRLTSDFCSLAHLTRTSSPFRMLIMFETLPPRFVKIRYSLSSSKNRLHTRHLCLTPSVFVKCRNGMV